MKDKPTTVLITYENMIVDLADVSKQPTDLLDSIVFDSKKEAIAYCSGVADGNSWGEVITKIE